MYRVVRNLNHGKFNFHRSLRSSLRYSSSYPAALRVEEETSIDIEETMKSQRYTVQVADWAARSYLMKPRSSLNDPTIATNPIEEMHLDEIDPIILREQGRMTEEEVNKWLMDYQIPVEEIAKCKTHDQVRKLRELYARQLRLECSVYDLAMNEREESLSNIHRIGRTHTTGPAKRLVLSWMSPVTDLIVKEQLECQHLSGKTDSNTYGPAFLLLDAKVLAAIGINVMLNGCLMQSGGERFIRLATSMGKAIQEEIVAKKKRYNKGFILQAKRKTKALHHEKMQALYANAGEWDPRTNLKIGAALIDVIQRSCLIPPDILKDLSASYKGRIRMDEVENPKNSIVHAFRHGYSVDRPGRCSGVFKLDTRIIDTILRTKPGTSILPWTARYLPMLVRPKPWGSVSDGGYLRLHTRLMRHRDSAWQVRCTQNGEMPEVYEALNLLGDVPWVINTEVLEVILKVWENGGGFGDLPQRTPIPLPEWKVEYKNDPTAFRDYERTKRKIIQRNQELYSLECDTTYKLQVAEEFRNEEALYFPCNMDFRGRVYPIPPNLNHLGSDMSRSLLVFKEKKPLGKEGLRWLKIHLANVFGVDKCSFDDRVKFIETNIDNVIESAKDPLGPSEANRWWKEADYPFIALGVCFELKRALESGNPEKYESNLPVHQDGSCNGLQHYAALGRDTSGAEQVNLVPSDAPCDVYSGVASQVVSRVEADARQVVEKPPVPIELQNLTNEDEMTDEQIKIQVKYRADLQKYNNHVHAKFLLGAISRKVVKQTVMTSVYGVTFIGARKQIAARLEEVFVSKGSIMNEELEEKIYHASCYAAEITMQSMGDLFTSARNIMAWLAECASLVALNNQLVSWVSPMGLPVCQPYRRPGTQQVRTKIQDVLLVSSEYLDVDKGKQKSAFPPNFVHCLDSTHMLKTALKCLRKDEDNITFAAVHDSYWTHAATTPLMNQRLREQFVELYSQPILEELRDDLETRFPNTKFPPIPKRGNLDLKVVLNSPYFFN